MSTSTRVRLLRGSGLLLLLLGIVHLVATPHIAALIRHSVSQDAADNLIPPMLLNHILVGVLLLPLGFLTFYAAPYSDRWAQVIVRTTALTVATLPLTLLWLMGLRYFDAPLFVVGFLLVVAASVTLLLAAFTRPRVANDNYRRGARDPIVSFRLRRSRAAYSAVRIFESCLFRFSVF